MTASDRRQFLRRSLGLPLAGSLMTGPLSAQPASNDLFQNAGGSAKGKKLLILGGTRFLGPAAVHIALKRGYEVTLFNRGKSNPDLFKGKVESLRGDRDTGDLKALEGRKWDLVIDTSGYVPEHVKQSAELLAPSVGHYVFISTLSVYQQAFGKLVSEESPVLEIAPAEAKKITTIKGVFKKMHAYGPLKALCEQAAEKAMPGRVTSIRPGVIVGRDDPTDRFLYWAIRVAQGGEVLCPGNPDAPVQFTDVRDIAKFALNFGAARTTGIFNAQGFDGVVTMQEMLHGCKIVLGSQTSFTWLPDEFLLEKKVRPFVELPFWLPKKYNMVFDNQKGLAAGMKFRPVGESILEAVAWHREVRDDSYQWGTYGMKAEREQKILKAFHG
jgi:2'-hydroxyisoflavone reductase